MLFEHTHFMCKLARAIVGSRLIAAVAIDLN
jgi:hypothetical protein